MKLALKDSLLFTAVTVSYQGKSIEVQDILVDTGSATTVLAVDSVAAIGISPLLEDTLYTIRGVGGAEVVFTRQVDYLQVDQQKVENFEIEVGGMDYGFPINGILGLDFLLTARAIINLSQLQISFDA